jgi:hypothetical protein
MKTTIFLLALLSASSAFGQKTTIPMPTVAQCRADRDAWQDVAPEHDSQSSFTEPRLEEMALEMSRCANVVDGRGPATKGFEPYTGVFMNIMSTIKGRYMNFVLRHPDVEAKFHQEDEAGAR